MADAYPKFDGFSLQNDNFITQEITYRNTPQRRLDSENLSRIPGVKLLATEFNERQISLSGHIIADSVSDLRDKIDALNTNVTRKDSGQLNIESDRSATATVASVMIQDPHYSQTYVPFDITFYLADPFFYGQQQTVSWTIASGTASLADTITISGSVFAEPIFTYSANGSSGFTTCSGIRLTYTSTGEYVTWSGTGGSSRLPYGGIVQFDYPSHSILLNQSEVDIDGVFVRWEPGPDSFSVTFSGTTQGGLLQMAYQPRYL